MRLFIKIQNQSLKCNLTPLQGWGEYQIYEYEYL